MQTPWSRCRTDDVLEFFGVEPPSRRAATHPFLELLPGSDELVRATRRASGDLAATLAELELSRLVA